jgi:hypothetical protein
VSEGVTQGAAVAPALRTPRLSLFARPRALRGGTLLCALGLGLLATGFCAAHVRHGGLYYDDWSLVALGRFPGPGGLLHSLWLSYGQRPGQVLYYAALDTAFGAAPSPRLALAAAMLALQATSLYALLRCLRMRALHAAAIAALALVFPFSDSLWLWGVMSLTSLAISAGLLSVVLALTALKRSGARAVTLHVTSLALLAASILSYEAFAVAGCLAGLLYVREVGLRRARVRWFLDIAVILAALAFARIALPIDVATPSRTQSLAGMLDHAGLIAARGARLIGAAVLPLAHVSPWIGTGLLTAVLAGAGLMWLRLPFTDGSRPELGRWLAIAGAGALAAVAAWAIYVPASDHYAPSAAGTVNRMNAAAGLGIAILVYACVVLAVRMLGRLVRLSASARSLVVAAAAMTLGAGYVDRSLRDAHSWDAAAADQRDVLADLRLALPRLPAGATVYVAGAPETVGPGIPVLNTTLDLTSAMRISYSRPDLAGVPLTAATGGLACRARGPAAAGVSGAYGRSYLFDAAARRGVRLRDRAQCAAEAGGRRLAPSG